MIYVFDTSTFIVLQHFYPGTFRTLWGQLDQLVGDGQIVSTREVLNELNSYNATSFIQDWAKRHKGIFTTPTNTELDFVRQIFAVRHFQALIGNAEMLKGKPVADPFVIAAAQVRKGTVVTQEKFKSNAAKVPNVCAHFGIPCLDLETFMTQQGWSF